MTAQERREGRRRREACGASGTPPARQAVRWRTPGQATISAPRERNPEEARTLDID